MSADAIESLKQGDLAGTLDSLQTAIRQDSADPKKRTFLFQLLAVLGNWDRALTQLDVVAEMDGATLPMAQAYREAIHCETFRAEVFAGRRSPLIFGEPEQWVADLVQALGHLAAGRLDEAAQHRQRAFESAPTTSGTVDGQAIEWIADADMRLGPVLEMIVDGKYYWVPFDRIHQLILEAPEDLRDMVWMPAQTVWANGGQSVALIPTRYAGTEGQEDDALRLARKTVWGEPSPGCYVGFGQRVVATDQDEKPLCEIREIVLDTVAPDGDGGSDDGPVDGVAGA